MDELRGIAREIFLKAIEEYLPEEWPAYVAKACADDLVLKSHVEQLLRAHQDLGTFRDDPPAVGQTQIAEMSRPGERIGPYKLLQELGEGGMGVVYLAEQSQPVERRVALKIIKPGMGSRQVIARFEAERQALAMMHHPNIAHVLDAGTTDGGRPYFAMELVKGIPITHYCDEHRLTIRQRITLFLDVCHAVQHAHQKGIIHRDLKPSNVLVAEYDDHAVPKIIDFGVAKAIEQRLTAKTMFTQIGQVVGTLDYMSPEQAKLNQLDIDTRSDVYSLGVLLYELFTGETPFDRKRLRSAAFDEVFRILREEEPSRPSVKLSGSASLPSIAAHRKVEPKKLGLLLRGDIDWIVMKCLEKERSRRYQTANGLADDLERYLSNEPVLACPPSASYRLRKFASRNKSLLWAGSLVTVSLILGIVTTAIFAAEALRSARLANERLLGEQQARRLASAAELNAHRRLFDSYLAQAEASRRSGRPGQQLDSLAAIQKATGLMHRVEVGETVRLQLRNEAIAAMALTDLRQLAHRELPRRDWWAQVDSRGELLASVDEPGFMSISQLHSGESVGGIRAEFDTSYPRGFSADGRHLLGFGPATKGWIWNVERQEKVVEFERQLSSGEAQPNWSVSVRGNLCAFIASRDAVQLYRLDTLEPGHTLKTQAMRLALSADGQKLAVSSAQNTGVEIWDCTTGRPLRVLNISFAQAIAWHPDGIHLACGVDYGYSIHVWNVETGTECAELIGHQNEGLDLSFNRDGSLLASAGWDGTGRLWKPLGGQELIRTSGKRCQFLGQGDRLMFAGPNEISVMEVCPSPVRMSFHAADPGRTLLFYAIAFWPGSELIAASRADGLRVWNTRTGQEVAYAPMGFSDALLFHEASQSLFTSGNRGVWQWPIQMSEDLTVIRVGPPRKLCDRAFTLANARNLVQSRDGTRIAANTGEGSVMVIDPEGTSEPLRLSGNGYYSKLAVSAGGQWVVAGGEDGITIWNAHTGERVQHLWAQDAVFCLEFLPGTNHLFAAIDAEIRMLQVADWQPDRTVPFSRLGQGFAHTANGRMMAMNQDNGVILMEWPTAHEIARLTSPGENGNIEAICLSADENRLAVAYRGAVEVWDLRRMRARLTDLNLDWKFPELPPASKVDKPGAVEFDLGLLAPPSARENSMENARLHMIMSEWNDAAEDYEKALDGETYPEYLFEIAGGLLIGGQPEKYRQVVQIMYDEHGGTTDHRTAYLLARASSLGPNDYTIADARRLALLAVRWQANAWYRHTLGLVCYREGKYSEAVEHLQHSEQQGWDANVLNWIALAMAYDRLEKPDESGRYWKMASEWMRDPKALHSHDRVAVKILHDEALRLLHSEE